MGEIEKNFKLYKLQQDFQLSLGEREDLISYKVIEDGTPFLFDTNGKGLSFWENEIRPQSPIPKENPYKDEVHSQF